MKLSLKVMLAIEIHKEHLQKPMQSFQNTLTSNCDRFKKRFITLGRNRSQLFIGANTRKVTFVELNHGG